MSSYRTWLESIANFWVRSHGFGFVLSSKKKDAGAEAAFLVRISIKHQQETLMLSAAFHSESEMVRALYSLAQSAEDSLQNPSGQ
jgi:hypothetical protein